MAAVAASALVTAATEASLKASVERRDANSQADGDGDGGGTLSERGRRSSSASSVGSNLQTLRVDVLRADMRLAANAGGVARKGRVGNIVALELERDASSSSASAGMYREYSRAELVDRLTRMIAKVCMPHWRSRWHSESHGSPSATSSAALASSTAR